jgi:anti-anti-sigma factor
MGLTVSTHRPDSRTLHLNVAGEVDLATAGILQHEIVAGLEADDVPDVVVDLAEVTFLDSSGISVLLKGRRLADENAKGYRVDAAHGMVRQVLDISGVWEYLGGQGTGRR